MRKESVATNGADSVALEWSFRHALPGDLLRFGGTLWHGVRGFVWNQDDKILALFGSGFTGVRQSGASGVEDTPLWPSDALCQQSNLAVADPG